MPLWEWEILNAPHFGSLLHLLVCEGFYVYVSDWLLLCLPSCPLHLVCCSLFSPLTRQPNASPRAYSWDRNIRGLPTAFSLPVCCGSQLGDKLRHKYHRFFLYKETGKTVYFYSTLVLSLKVVQTLYVSRVLHYDGINFKALFPRDKRENSNQWSMREKRGSSIAQHVGRVQCSLSSFCCHDLWGLRNLNDGRKLRRFSSWTYVSMWRTKGWMWVKLHKAPPM